jgi:hypothetical protein
MDVTNWKIQGELRRFKQKPFVELSGRRSSPCIFQVLHPYASEVSLSLMLIKSKKCESIYKVRKWILCFCIEIISV